MEQGLEVLCNEVDSDKRKNLQRMRRGWLLSPKIQAGAVQQGCVMGAHHGASWESKC